MTDSKKSATARPVLDVLWQRVMVGAATCERCGDTGEAVRLVARRLREELAGQGIEVRLEEKALPPFAVTESNRVFFNGESLEDILGAQVGMSHCQSCCDMLGSQTDCRTLILDGREHEALSEELLLRAGRLVAGRMATS